ncbi:uroporphyrinogen-III synthase [Maritimibacter dapengensis]|uniref:Uroporphyrinogen-III synthase n=1 Tax=Maritimibacter dapengensis TaxID=2836868 RepID=A0ABS6T5X1_9RHOB|nr:uroporphyrinogen-III synthase [Maritimibacter dapengensis]MBV7379921.1 uroporphyrinogen-III synthase [Maritimibacter dapengensis]
MTRTPTLVLTRPIVASERIARLYDGPVVVSPVLQIVGTDASIRLSGYAGVILTSANAIPFLPDLHGVPAYVVGQETAAACQADVRLVARDADDLVSRVTARGPLLHLCGRETRGDIAHRLSSAGIGTDSVVIYEQRAQDLTEDAKALIENGEAVILPLWSPRSAQLVGRQIKTISPGVRVIAFSPAVAKAWFDETGGDCVTCAEPTREEMLRQVDVAKVG